MSWMFRDCTSIISLPDISKWNISNVINTIGMFNNFDSLISFIDISKWNFSNNKNITMMFS